MVRCLTYSSMISLGCPAVPARTHDFCMLTVIILLSQVYYEAFLMFFNSLSLTRNRLLLVAPANACLEPFNGEITPSDRMHASLIADVQRLRGAVYLDDGAIDQSELTP